MLVQSVYLARDLKNTMSKKAVVLDVTFFASPNCHLQENLIVSMRAWIYLPGQSCIPVRQWLERKGNRFNCDWKKEVVKMNQISEKVLKDRKGKRHPLEQGTEAVA